MPEREVEEFLYRAAKRRWQEVAGSQLPAGEAVKDSEQVGPGPWQGRGRGGPGPPKSALGTKLCPHRRCTSW